MWGQTAESPFEVLDRLSTRQREIVAALLQGQRTRAIAASLFVSSSTVRSHLSAIFEAFGVRSQTELLSLLRSQKSPSDGTAPPNS
jgi:DNA-binding NarL/FixJ family response regulator